MRILNNQLQYVHVADAWDCYNKLRNRLSKDGKEKLKMELEEYKLNDNERMLKNTTFISKYTMIGYCMDDKDEFDAKVANPHYPHIIYTDRMNSVSPSM